MPPRKKATKATPPKKTPPRKARIPKVSSTGGGVAGKLGDRYEAWWTILRGILPVLAGDFTAIRVEEPGFDAVEFRLLGGRGGASDEAHQCKKTHRSTWTVNALKTENFLGQWAVMTDAGMRVVFVSEQWSVVRQMATKAQSLTDVDDWLKDLNYDEGVARAQLVREWAVGPDAVHRRLRMTTVEQMGESTLRFTLLGMLNTAVAGDPEAVLGLLRGYIEDHFGEDLTADKIWKFLRDKGHDPAAGFSPALSELVRATVTTYVGHVEALRPAALTEVTRSEADRISDELQRLDGPPVVVVTGRPGAGKSHVLAEVCGRLASRGLTTGVLRLDVAQPAHTAADLGAQTGIGFGGSPPQVLARASGGGPSVLVVDQADTASMLSGRGHTVYEALRDLLQQARSTAGMKVLLACRSEDLRFDTNLRRLVNPDDATPGSAARIDLGDLTADQVRTALTAIGLDASSLPTPLQQLCANVFNLALFVRIYEAADEAHRPALTTVRTRLQLLREYHTQMSARMLQALGPNVYGAATLRVAKAMSDNGTLRNMSTCLRHRIAEFTERPPLAGRLAR